MSKLEQVAEAIWNAEAVRAASRRFEDWSDVGEATKDKYRPLALAAIEAMKGPTPKMVEAGREMHQIGEGQQVFRANIVTSIFDTMIDHILSETKPEAPNHTGETK